MANTDQLALHQHSTASHENIINLDATEALARLDMEDGDLTRSVRHVCDWSKLPRSWWWWGRLVRHLPSVALHDENHTRRLYRKGCSCTVTYSAFAHRGPCVTAIASTLTGLVRHITLSGLVLVIATANAYRWAPKRINTIFRFDQAPIADQYLLGVKRHHVAEQAPPKIALRYAMRLLTFVSTSLSQLAIRRCWLFRLLLSK